MAYTALYREWRPKNFEDVVGQEHITTTLKNQIQNDRIAHAYLFCGTRGTGKTSTAKVMAKALNCLNPVNGDPCNECEMCKKINEGLAIDVTELDAASNNGVDKIRDIIDDAKYPPQEARFKVYIMDEVHMLSMGAVNAFLKTLEEPPANVIFILATTDPQKLPITILSRCQRFDFKRISKSDISDRLRKIVGAQGVLADEKSLELISRVSDGAMRDALSILDQAIAMGDGSVNYDNVVGMLGLVTNEYLFNITSAIIERNIQRAMNIIEEVVYAGKDINLFIKDLTGHFRNLLMAKVTNNPEEVLDMSMENINLIKEQGSRIRVEEIMRDIRILQEAEGNAKISKQARLYLELATIKMCKIEYDTSSEVILARINRLEEAIKSGKIQVAQVQQGSNQISEVSNVQKIVATQNVINKEQAVTETPVIEVNTNATTSIGDIQRSWHDILEALKARRAMVIYASLMTGRPVACNNGVVVIKYEEEYAFNKIRLEKPDNIKVINEVVSEVMRERLKVRFTVETKEEAERNPEEVLLQALGESALEIIDE
ncbi:MAG: DNA polymerase III subunit gamma/tau [Clostridium sp.]|uniref:DNA-directed DNA polymerase n=1 Tax=Clostridium paraputrificum TaxID=29363 RepID=A0A6N3E9P7_9CLOT|nr:DNA polymerase III subunit gamma/tau [Clostridium sp.]MBS5927606.1 DNA polymerase III subunit gamma/tau [Clostridium sp.]MBS5986589.1 DNA polymerase III subunit gamma/tau [Clostridium sp.]